MRHGINGNEESDDLSDEAVRAVMAHMKQKLAAQMTTKPWYGYRDRELGQLVFIENGHGFQVL